LLNRLAPAVESGKSNAIQMLMVSGANPCYSLQEPALVKQAFDRIPVVVSFSPDMDETTQMADYILPNHNYLERFQDVSAPDGYHKPFVGLTKPVVQPQFNTRHVGDTIMALARKLGGAIAQSFPWENYETCLKKTLGGNWDTLLEKGYWVDAGYKAPKAGKFVFPGSKIKVEPVAIEGDEKRFPLVLIPSDSMQLSNTFSANTPFMTKTVADTVLRGNDMFVEVNPKTAGELRLREGRHAELATPKGSARVRVHLSDRIGPGLVALPTGLGHTAYDKFLAGKGVNYNELAGPVEDPASGFDAAWGIRAVLRKT
jgi:anaerobic selenocysteine-containing dehydrogenase